MKRARSNTNSWYVDDTGTFLDEGSYAVVYSSDRDPDNFIYRYQIIDNSETDPNIDCKRAMAIHQSLYSYKLSPCIPFLEPESQTVRLDELPNRLRPRLSFLAKEMEIHAKETFILISRIERGTKGNLSQFARNLKNSTVRNFLFLLLWTHWTANTKLGFRHGDIKQANIVVKALPTETTFGFCVRNHGTYRLTCSFVPMIIDYDFASVSTTPFAARYLIGTLMTSPPEVLAHFILFPDYDLNVYHNGLFSENAREIWCIAMSVLSAWTNGHPFLSRGWDAIRDNLPFLAGPNALLRDDAVRDKHIILYQLCFMQKALGNGMFPPPITIGRIYSSFLFTDDLRQRLDVLDTKLKISSKMKKTLETHKNASKSLLRVFKRLFDWRPDVRSFDGELYRVFDILETKTMEKIVVHYEHDKMEMK